MIFDEEKTNYLEFEKGILVRRKTESGHERLIEIKNVPHLSLLNIVNMMMAVGVVIDRKMWDDPMPAVICAVCCLEHCNDVDKVVRTMLELCSFVW